MNRKTLFLLILFFLAVNVLVAQLKKVRFVDKVGDTITGYGRLYETEYNEMFEFKDNPLAKPRTYYLYNIKFYEFIDDYEVEQIQISSGRPLSASVLYRGEVSLYKYSTAASSTPTWGANGVMMMHSGGSLDYYIKKDTESRATHVKTDLGFGKSFRKTAMEYFKDCEELVEKLKKREFKSKHLIEVVYFYDKKCNQ